jgi:adenosylcobinamide-phosphate synthase
VNRYGGSFRSKPVLGREHPAADAEAVERILQLTARLEAVWILGGVGVLAAAQHLLDG